MPSYSDFKTAIATTAFIDVNNTDFNTIFPTLINYAEGRICRELDMLISNVRDSSSSTTSGSRNFNLPVPYTDRPFLIVTGLNVITPASTAPDAGTRTPLTPVSLSFLDLCHGDSSDEGVPEYFNYLSQDTYSSPAPTQVILGPWPDDTYRLEVIGKIMPQALSATNTNTFLSDNLFDLLFAAGMVFISGYKENFGAQADNPQQAMSWETQYKTLKESAATWQARARFAGASWTAQAVEPMALPQRG